MSSSAFPNRFWIVAALLIGATILLHATNQRPKRPLRQPLKDIPLAMGEWRGTEIPIEERIVTALGVDEYLNRNYTDSNGNSLEFYIGYFGSQRSGELIHSPKNCLPGAGWEWVRTGRLNLALPNRPSIQINDFRIAKGLKQALVLYWYQGRGRSIANEYTAKFWMIADAMFRHRTDGSLVRVVIPLTKGEQDARALGVHFLQSVYPSLEQSIPD
jgi:EpsI family protein